jgi:hypothetical protein
MTMGFTMHVREILLVTSGLNYKNIAYDPLTLIVKPEVVPTVHDGEFRCSKSRAIVLRQ